MVTPVSITSIANMAAAGGIDMPSGFQVGPVGAPAGSIMPTGGGAGGAGGGFPDIFSDLGSIFGAIQGPGNPTVAPNLRPPAPLGAPRSNPGAINPAVLQQIMAMLQGQGGAPTGIPTLGDLIPGV